MKPYLPKEDDALPDSFTAFVTFHDGKVQEFDIAGYSKFGSTRMFDFVTVEDEFHWIPLEAIRYIRFDKNFSKIVAISSKREEEKKREAARAKAVR